MSCAGAPCDQNRWWLCRTVWHKFPPVEWTEVLFLQTSFRTTESLWPLFRCLLDTVIASMDITISRYGESAPGGSGAGTGPGEAGPGAPADSAALIPGAPPGAGPGAGGAAPPAKEMRASGQTARMLGLIACLVNQQPAIKSAFLQLCRSG